MGRRGSKGGGRRSKRGGRGGKGGGRGGEGAQRERACQVGEGARVSLKALDTSGRQLNNALEEAGLLPPVGPARAADAPKPLGVSPAAAGGDGLTGKKAPERRGEGMKKAGKKMAGKKKGKGSK